MNYSSTWVQGYRAREEGKPLEDNPYKKSTDEYIVWKKGWGDCNGDLKPLGLGMTELTKWQYEVLYQFAQEGPTNKCVGCRRTVDELVDMGLIERRFDKTYQTFRATPKGIKYLEGKNH